jgi:hypothetical protein
LEVQIQGADIIRANGKTFGEQIQTLSKMKGGSSKKTRSTHLKNKKPNKKYRNTRKYKRQLGGGILSDYVQEEIQKNQLLQEFFGAFNGSGIAITDIEDFLYVIYNYLYYIGETPLNYSVLANLFSLSILNESDITFEQFKEFYESIIDTEINTDQLVEAKAVILARDTGISRSNNQTAKANRASTTRMTAY